MNNKILYKISPNESFEAEGRIFFKNELYPVLEKDEKYVILCAENGDFAFSKELMERAIKEWELTVHKQQKDEKSNDL